MNETANITCPECKALIAFPLNVTGSAEVKCPECGTLIERENIKELISKLDDSFGKAIKSIEEKKKKLGIGNQYRY